MANVYHRNAFLLQLLVSLTIMMLEYMQILNLYNCERWGCSTVPCGGLLLIAVTALVFQENFDLSLPLLISHTLGAAGLLFWSIEWWNVATRHRTEFYDTHMMYCSLAFFSNVFTIYRYLDKEGERSSLEEAVRSVIFRRLQEGDLLNNLPPVNRYEKGVPSDESESEPVEVVITGHEPEGQFVNEPFGTTPRDRQLPAE
ncbi:hypothetical protein DIPPA_17610 [Diplonema papillatum]|nr:hypothetical protein DIPPA_17610 [Diplonema papillatum]